MSILLDALKKSEAQRQLGSIPTLHSPATGEVPLAGDDRIWIPAMMLLLSAVVIAWIGIAQYHRPETAAVVPVAVQEVGQQEIKAAAPAPQPDNKLQRPAKTPVMDYAAEPSASVSTKVPGKSSEAVTRKSSNPAGPSGEKELADQRRVAALAAAEESLAAARNLVSAPANEPEPATETRQKQTDRLQPYVADPISYWQVPESVRKEMPKLHISVLVYAKNPEDRFLLINGERLREKDKVSDGLVLEEIQRDGAIFTFHKYRFQVKN